MEEPKQAHLQATTDTKAGQVRLTPEGQDGGTTSLRAQLASGVCIWSSKLHVACRPLGCEDSEETSALVPKVFFLVPPWDCHQGQDKL